MDFLYLKAIHLVFVVSWFAALFYIVRLFIYTAEAQLKDDISRPILTAQLLLMQKKLWYIIGWPAMVGTHIFGFWMLFQNPAYLGALMNTTGYQGLMFNPDKVPSGTAPKTFSELVDSKWKDKLGLSDGQNAWARWASSA